VRVDGRDAVQVAVQERVVSPESSFEEGEAREDTGDDSSRGAWGRGERRRRRRRRRSLVVAVDRGQSQSTARGVEASVGGAVSGQRGVEGRAEGQCTHDH
jgi:hypothetical protein